MAVEGINTGVASPSFYGEEQKRKSGIGAFGIGTLGAGFAASQLMKKPMTQDLFEKNLKEGTEIKYKPELTADEKTKVDNATIEAKSEAPKTDAPKTDAPKVEGTKEVTGEVNTLEQAEKELSNAVTDHKRATETLNVEQKLTNKIQETYDKVESFSGEKKPLGEKETEEALKTKKQELNANNNDLDTKLKDDRLSNPKKEEIKKKIEANNKEIEEIDSKTMKPEEFKKQHIQGLAKTAEEDAKKASEATDKALKAKNEATESFNTVKKELDDAKNAKKAETEIKTLEGKVADAKGKLEIATHEHKIKQIESNFAKDLEKSLKDETNVKSNLTKLFDKQTAKVTIDKDGNLIGKATTAVDEAGKNVAEKLIRRNDFKENSGKITAFEKELESLLGKPETIIKKETPSTGGAVKTALTEAYEAVKGKLPKTKAGLTLAVAGIGLGVGAIMAMIVRSGNKSEQA